MRTRMRARDLFRAESSSAKITAPWTVRRKHGACKNLATSATAEKKKQKNNQIKWVEKTTQRLAQLTVVSSVADALVLRVKHGLLKHPKYDDGADPELYSQKVPPVAGAPQQPEGAKENVHDAHGHEELQVGKQGGQQCW